MSSQPGPRLTPEQYLAIERAAEFKSEYCKGEMFAMAGASLAHGVVAANLLAALHAGLRTSNCCPFAADVRVSVPGEEFYTYPDVAVDCGKNAYTGTEDTLLHPVLIAEVLSPSTEAYDRGKKFELYQAINSLNYYLLVAQDRVHVDLYTRQPGGAWLLSTWSNLEETIPLAALGCSLPLAELYRRLQF